MTALAGFWRAGKNISRLDSARMLRGMSNLGRGPMRIWRSDCAELGRRLMPTVPEDALDRQPCAARGGSLRLIADIRLDNRNELAADLGLGGADLSLLADADVLMYAWERFGDGCLDRLVGDYAFALWDEVSRRLMLVRDPMGSRPLFYFVGKDFVAFASMPSGLLALPDIPCTLDEEHLARGVMHVPGRSDRSFFSGIRSVSPGDVLTIGDREICRRRFWQFEDVEPLHFKNPDDYAELVREAFDRAVASQLRTLGGVCTQLSAGLDSSCVTATAASLLARQAGRIVAFTAAPRQGYDLPGPPGCLIDESAHAAAVAAFHGNIDHIIRRSGSATPFDQLHRYLLAFQQPTVNLCNHVWMDDLWSAAAERGLQTMLTGLLGNATISYRHSLGRPQDAIRLLMAGRAPLQVASSALLKSLLPDRLWFPLKRLFRGQSHARAAYSVANPILWREWHAARHNDSAEPLTDANPDRRRLILESVDFASFNKGVLAAWGIDQRHPAIDLRVIEVCLAIPLQEFTRDGVPAAVYRRAFASRLPPLVLREKLRGLQAPDWHEGLAAGRAKLLTEIDAIETNEIARRVLDVPRLRHLAATLPERGEEYVAATPTLRFALLRGVALGHFITHAKELAAGSIGSALVGDDLQIEEVF